MKIVVIGAGVAGLSIGWRLALAGANVTVLERALPGRGATWASGGMIAAAAENADETTAEARFARRAAGLWPSFAAELEEKSGQAIAYRRCGTLVIASNAPNYEQLAARAGQGASLLSAAQALQLEPMLHPDVAGALWAPDDAQVDNRALGAALANAFIKAGGRLQVNESAVLFEAAGDRAAAVRTPFARYEAEAFVLAAGAWSGEIKGLPPGAAPPVVPVKGEMIALTPVPGAALPQHLVWGNEIYVIPRMQHIFVGATSSREGFDSSLTRAARIWLMEHAHALMPALANWSLADHWAGLRPGAPDDLPIIGETSLKGLFVASGQYRNGILFAPAVADAMRDIVLNQTTPDDVAAFSPARFLSGAV